ncbi:MAG: hypothetical protein ACUVTG_09010 [Candidatus Oleimicrobiaceae bacterium]
MQIERAPTHIPHKTPKEIENRVIELRKTHPAWGPERLKMHYQLPISTKAIARIIRQAGLVREEGKEVGETETVAGGKEEAIADERDGYEGPIRHRALLVTNV